MNLEETVQGQLNGLIADGVVEKIIKDQLEATIKSIFNSSLREYSDFGKELEKVIKQSLQVDLSRVSTLKYQQIVTDIVSAQLKEHIASSIQEPINKRIKGILNPLEDRVYKLSEIVDAFKQSECDSDSEGEITLLVEYSNYGSVHISIDKEADKSTYDCAYRFSMDKKECKIYHYVLENRDAGKSVLNKPINGSFDSLIFNLYASKTTIELDENKCETEWYRD